jgi:hypothetical protein
VRPVLWHQEHGGEPAVAAVLPTPEGVSGYVKAIGPGARTVFGLNHDQSGGLLWRWDADGWAPATLPEEGRPAGACFLADGRTVVHGEADLGEGDPARVWVGDGAGPWTAGTLDAGGPHRTVSQCVGSPGGGAVLAGSDGLRGAVWRSDDGQTFERVAEPFAEVVRLDLAAVDDQVIAVAGVDLANRSVALWTSHDDGHTWTRHDLSELRDPTAQHELQAMTLTGNGRLVIVTRAGERTRAWIGHPHWARRDDVHSR